MSWIEIKCHLCPSVIYGNDVQQALKESNYHGATAHPVKDSPPGDAQRQSERLSGESDTTTATQATEATGDDRGNND